MDLISLGSALNTILLARGVDAPSSDVSSLGETWGGCGLSMLDPINDEYPASIRYSARALTDCVFSCIAMALSMQLNSQRNDPKSGRAKNLAKSLGTLRICISFGRLLFIDKDTLEE